MKKTIFWSTLLCATISYAQLATGSAKFLGNITTNYAIKSDFLQYWNQITGENECKWGSVENTRDQYNWTGCDRIYNYSKQNNIPSKFHTLVWGSQYPKWMDNLNSSQQLEEITEWYDLVKQRYPDLEIIDVVNEAVTGHAPAPYKNALGGDGTTGYDWIIEAFKMARERWPNAVLVYNDYNAITWQRTQFIALMNAINGSGYVDAMGLQSHGLEHLTTAQLKANLEEIHNSVGLPILISEYDVSEADDEAQKQIYQNQFPVFWEADYVAGVTLWGYVDGSTWVDNTGILRANGTERPSFTWLKSYIAANKNVKSPINWSNLGGPKIITPANISMEQGITEVVSLSGSDGATWTISGGSDASLFNLSGNNSSTLNFKSAPLWNSPGDANSDNNYQITLTATLAGKSASLDLTVNIQRPQAPYKTIPLAIPGIIEVEDYDFGGDGVSYHDNDSLNEGETYREDGVDLSGNETDGFVLGWTQTGEWLEYTVNITEAKSYEWKAKVAAGLDNAAFRVLLDGTPIIDSVAVPNGGDWSTYSELTGITSAIPAGQHVLRLEVLGSYFNIDWIEFYTDDVTLLDSQSSYLIVGNNEFQLFNLKGQNLGILQTHSMGDLKEKLFDLGLKKGIYYLKDLKSQELYKVIH